MAITQQTSQLRRITKEQFNASTVAEIIKSDGGLILEGFFDPELVERVNKEMDPSFAALDAGSKRDDEFTVDFHGKNTKRLTNLVTISEAFREKLLDHDDVHEVAELVFRKESGSYWLTSAQAIEIGPNSAPQTLHRDMENWYPFLGMGPAGPEVSLNFLMAVTDFTVENGATRVLPGSHLWQDYENRGTIEQTIPAVMKAGDVLCIGGKIVHGGGANGTTNKYRRGIAFSFNPGFLTVEEAYPFIVPMEIAKGMSKRAQQMIGFRSQYPKGSPGLWQYNYTELAEFTKI